MAESKAKIARAKSQRTGLGGVGKSADSSFQGPQVVGPKVVGGFCGDAEAKAKVNKKKKQNKADTEHHRGPMSSERI